MSSKPPVINNPLLEVNPSACLFVLGPAATGSSSCKELLELATKYLQGSKKISFSAKRKLIAEIKKTDKTDVGAALQRAVETLKKFDCFSEWLHLAYSEASSTPPTRTLDKLLELQRQGALLACTQLDSLPGTRQVTLHDEEAFKNWLHSGHVCDEEYVNVESDDTPPVLHLCGIYSQADTVRIRETDEPREKVELSSLEKKLWDLLQDKLVVFVGICGETHNPFLLNFMDRYYPCSGERVLKYPPIMLTSSASRKGSSKKDAVHEDVFSHFLIFEVNDEDESLLGCSISQGSKKNFTVARGVADKQADLTKFQAFLLFNEKQSFRKLGEIIYHQSRSGEIYVRRDALTVVYSSGKILYSNIITYGGSGLKQLWGLVFADGSTLLGKGLVAFGLQNSAIVWMKGRPESLGDISEVSTTYAGRNSAVTTMKSLAPQTTILTTQASLRYPDTVWSIPAAITPHMNLINRSTLTAHTNHEALSTNIHVPPPPKLIKIPVTSTKDLLGPEDRAKHSLAATSNGDPSVQIANAVSADHDSSDTSYIQAIVKLQERINQQLSGLNTTSDDAAHVIPPPSQNKTHPSQCPPRFCVAGPSELLLDIISETKFIRTHEQAIRKIENPKKQHLSLVDMPTVTANNSDKLSNIPKLIQHTDTSSRTNNSPLSNGGASPTNFQKKKHHSDEVSQTTHSPDENSLSISSSSMIASPAVNPVIYNQTAPGIPLPNVVMTPSVPNYCVALNTYPVMFVNSVIPLGTGLPGNQVLCYMPRNGLVNSLISQDSNGLNISPTKQQLQQNKTATLCNSLGVHGTVPQTLSLGNQAETDLSAPPAKRPRIESMRHSIVNGSSGKQMVLESNARNYLAVENEADNEAAGVGSSSQSTSPHSTLTSDGSVQLWIFLLDLLLSPGYRHIVHWTGNQYEFRIAQPTGLARLWGTHRNKPQMTYEKMSRALRYYYSRGIIESVRGRKQTFRFSLDLCKYVSSNKDQKTLNYLKSCCHIE